MLMNPLYLSIMLAAASPNCWFTEALSVKCLSHYFNAGKYVSYGIVMNKQQQMISIVYSNNPFLLRSAGVGFG